MKKQLIVGVLVIGTFLVGAFSGSSNPTQPINLDSSQSQSETLTKKQPITVPSCDGVNVTTNCTLEGINYSSYIYHAAVPEKSHTETVTTYKQEVSGYCTLCNDGTYSPSCATGRGACSYHGGVAQWNAPVQRNVPQYSTKKVIDVPAREAYYQKVVQ